MNNYGRTATVVLIIGLTVWRITFLVIALLDGYDSPQKQFDEYWSERGYENLDKSNINDYLNQ